MLVQKKMEPLTIKLPDFQKQYRSIGMITAKLITHPDNQYFLEIGENKFPASLHSKFKRWLQKNTANIGDKKTFSVYLRSIKTYPYYKFCVIGIYDVQVTYNSFSIRGLIKKWDSSSKRYSVEVRRNRRSKDTPPQKFVVEVYGENEQPQKDCLLAFSDLQCSFRNGALFIDSSQMVYKPCFGKNQNHKQPKQFSSKPTPKPILKKVASRN